MEKFYYGERTAITATPEGGVEVWTAGSTGRTRLFKNSKGTAILASDNGSWWSQSREEAEHCYFGQYWMGEFPYSSWCVALRVCKVTGEIVTSVIETDINPRGATQSDRWKQKCRAYAPQGAA